MTGSLPLYLLFAEAQIDEDENCRWRFSLEHVASGVTFSASDCEPVDRPERIELLAVVRGLEALDEPARVTLVTKSRYVSRGLRRGLAEWRNNQWRWERFGKLVPVRDWDLWRRVDRALEFHRVDCRVWQFGAEEAVPAPVELPEAEPAAAGDPVGPGVGDALAAGRRNVGRARRAARRRLGQVAAAARNLGQSVAGPALAAG